MYEGVVIKMEWRMQMNKENMWDWVKQANSIAIAGHVRPDGDCIGSCMALYQYIKKEYPNKNTKVYFENVPESFQYLFEKEEMNIGFENMEEAELFFSIDCSDLERLGLAAKLFEKAEHTICIDHHISNTGYAKLNYIAPTASSAAEVVFELLEEEKINKEVATSIYLGIVHDSGVFKYSNVSRRTMEIAGILVEKGVETTSLIDNTFYHKTYIQNQILGRVLLESILVLDGKGIVSCVTKKMMDFYGCVTSDLDGIVEQLRITDGVEVAIFLHELEPLSYKVSMRSKDVVDVSKIAAQFGGGGHIKAAGCTMTGTFHDIINSILELVDLQMKEVRL